MASNILFIEDAETRGKINIDDLYEKQYQRDIKSVSTFNKILNRIHKRITTTARNKRVDKHIWFVVPTYLFGEPNYDQSDCVAYVVSQLTDNGFHVRYVHPNTLFVSWETWVPSYVRNKIKKQTGMIINEKGVVIDKSANERDDTDPNQALLNDKQGNLQQKTGKEYTPIGTYKPTGNLVYNPDMFHRISQKVDNS